MVVADTSSGQHSAIKISLDDASTTGTGSLAANNKSHGCCWPCCCTFLVQRPNSTRTYPCSGQSDCILNSIGDPDSLAATSPLLLSTHQSR
ncbi:hypothetical protein J6590_034757 [Homalodisca vitripennis]|nr:hypothetical protein J6590_034757 [Homalodisca vitripennis]